MTASNEHLRDEDFDAWLTRSSDSDDDADPVGTHLRSCTQCTDRLARLRELEMTLRYTPPTAGVADQCPPEEVWIDVAAGMTDDALALELLEHAARCSRCSNLLRDATDTICPNLSTDELRALKKLKLERTKLPNATSRFALRPASAKTLGIPLPLYRAHRGIAVAVAATCLLVASIFLVRWYLVEHSPKRLLAQAYQKKRLTPMRIRGAPYVPGAVQRAAGPTPTGELPPELLEASAKAQSQLEVSRNSGYWHAIQGEVYLLENDPGRAVQEYSLAVAYAPTEDEFELGLGTANCASAIHNGNADQYAQGIEYLNRFIRRHPSDPVALYNSALCLRHAGMLYQARERFERASAEEKDPTWKHEINEQISSINSLLGNSGLRGTFQEHSSGTQQVADLVLAERVNEEGDPDRALDLARRALLAARRERRLEDEFNSWYEVIYALQRSSRAQDCITEARRALARRDLQNYEDIRTRLVLELGICSNIGGDFQAALRYLTEAASHAVNGPSLDVAYRSQGMLAGLLNSEGLHAQAENLDLDGLANWLQRPANPMRAYQFLSDLFFNNVAQGRYFAANEIEQEATRYALLTSNATIRSFAFEKLAETCIEIGDQTCARSSFDRAIEERSVLSKGPSERFYELDWAIQQARILLNQGRVQEAENLVSGVDPELGNGNFMESLAYAAVVAQLKMAKGDPGAVQTATDAAQAAVRLRSTIGADRARFAWINDVRPVFETLVAAEEAAGDVSKAFYCWESYRSLLRRESRPCDPPPSSELLVRATVVSFSRIGNQYRGWILSQGRVRGLGKPSDAANVESLAKIFESLCARPDSRESDLRLVGEALVGALFGDSFDQLVAEPGALVVEADAGLVRLPFRALPTLDGTFLGVRKPVAMIPGLWTLGPHSLRSPQYSSVALLSASAADSSLAESDETSSLNFGTAHKERSVVADFSEASRRFDSANFVYYSGHASENEVTTVALSLPPMLRQCRYVVVAACSTGVSQEFSSEAFALLPERLLQSGAVAVVATRWNVDSGRTARLMQLFSRNLRAPMNFEVALQKASAELFAAGDWHPYYWAAFDVYGT